MVNEIMNAIDEHLGSEVEELVTKPLGALRTPCPWIGATYVKYHHDRRVASTAVATAIGCGKDDLAIVSDRPVYSQKTLVTDLNDSTL